MSDSILTASASLETPAEIVVLGKVVGAYGLRGAVRVHPFADDPLAWGKLSHWWVGKDEALPATWQQTRLVRCKLHGETLIAELECFPDRNASELAHGFLVGVPRALLPAVAKDEYYWADLIGLRVLNTQDQPLGQVLGLIETSANDVLRIADDEGVARGGCAVRRLGNRHYGQGFAQQVVVADLGFVSDRCQRCHVPLA